MADFLVLKIKYDGTLRRISVPKSPEPTFLYLQQKIRDIFQLSDSPLAITYSDSDGDVITLANDDDIKDAVTFQNLNPLRLSVSLSSDAPVPQAPQSEADPSPKQEESSAGKANANAEKIQESFEEKLKTAFGVDVESLASAFQPLLSVAPKALDEIMEAALKAGFKASFEPNFYAKAACDGQTSAAEKEVLETKCKQSCVSKEAEDSTSAERVFHTGVQCDVCGMTPIVGPRYKSTLKDDYDLCRSCFEQHGAAGEYNKIERALYRPPQCPFFANGGRSGYNAYPCGPGSRVSFGGRPFHMGRAGGCGRSFDNRSAEGKLDSRFVKDVTIFDGTEFAPGTPFTKIWRLRNTGSIPWPQQTRLVQVGGDAFGSDDNFGVPLPEEGLQPGEEVEASVDLVAPEKAGRYVSHWRLVAPGGRKFGHRVWVLIHVVPNDEPSPQVAESVADTTIDVEAGPSAPPLEESVMETPEEFPPLEVMEKIVQDIISADDNRVPELAEELPVGANAVQKEEFIETKENVVNIPVVFGESSAAPVAAQPEEEKTSVGGFSLVDHPAAESTDDNVVQNVVSVPVEDVEGEESGAMDVEVIVLGNNAGRGAAAVEPVNVDSGNQKVEELLGQLEVMGFSDRESNIELLWKHNMDIARVLDDLVAASEWDPMLEELEEMGFYDTKVNRRLMFKNKGSVKAVVKELVQMYRQREEEVA